MPTETVIPTDAAKAARRAAYALLLDHYDEEHKRYKGDMSDQRIAEMTNLSLAKVSAMRDEDFGPAGPPPQLINLKQQLIRLEERVKAEEDKIVKSIDTVTNLKTEIEQAQAQLTSLISVHGWEAK